MITPIPNHLEQAIARLLTQYQNAPVLQGLLAGLIVNIQDLEDEMQAMNTDRYPAGAFGQQLDNIGQIVGLARVAGQSDASYLLDIYGQIKINTSDGQPEQIIQLFILLTQVSPAYLFEFYPGEYLIESTYIPPNQATTDQIIDNLLAASPAGVACGGLINIPSGPCFRYAGVLPSGGYGSLYAAGGGGYGSIYLHS
jgi:hypothetical protein